MNSPCRSRATVSSRFSGPVRVFFALVIVICVPVSTVLADIVTTKSGKKIEGKIIESNDRWVKVKTKFEGVKTIPRADVLKEQIIKTKADIYKEKLAKLDPKDVKAQWALAEWCKKEKAYAEHRKQLKRVVAIDPDHAEARKRLGQVKFDGKWVKKSEVKKLQRAKLKAEMAGSGRVKYKGKWVTPDEKTKLELGMVQYEGGWLPKSAKKFIDKGFVLYEGEWLRPKTVEKRKANLFRVGRKWVPAAEADTFHAEDETPWQLELVESTLQSTADWKHVDESKKHLVEAGEWFRKFGFGHGPKKRLLVLIFGTADGYNDAQTQVQSETMHFAYHSATSGGVYNPALEAATCYKFRADYNTRYLMHAFGETWFTRSLPESAHKDLWFMLGVGHMLGWEMTTKTLDVKQIRYLISDKLFIPLGELLSVEMMKGMEMTPDRAWINRFFAQSALLIHMLLNDPRYQSKFETFRKTVCSGKGTPTKTFKKLFDAKEVEAALLKLLQSETALPTQK